MVLFIACLMLTLVRVASPAMPKVPARGWMRMGQRDGFLFCPPSMAKEDPIKYDVLNSL